MVTLFSEEALVSPVSLPEVSCPCVTGAAGTSAFFGAHPVMLPTIAPAINNAIILLFILLPPSH